MSKRTFFSCGVDWQHDIGDASYLEGRMPLYSSVAALKKARRCWKQCGIVELEMKVVKWRKKQDLFQKRKKQ